MKETEAHNVPMRTDKKPLDVDKYKHLLQLSSETEEEETLAVKPQMHVPLEQEGVKMMSRVMDIHCPHCGEHVGRWNFFHRLAASEELEEKELEAKLLEEKESLEGKLNSLKELLASENVVDKYKEMYKELEDHSEK